MAPRWLVRYSCSQSDSTDSHWAVPSNARFTADAQFRRFSTFEMPTAVEIRQVKAGDQRLSEFIMDVPLTRTVEDKGAPAKTGRLLSGSCEEIGAIMAMTLDELRQLRSQANWELALPVQLTVLLVIMALLIAAGYFPDMEPPAGADRRWQAKGGGAEKGLFDKKAKAVNLMPTSSKLLEIEQSFGAAETVARRKSEVDALVDTEINQVGLGRFAVPVVVQTRSGKSWKTETAELPVTIKIAGCYHDLSAFCQRCGPAFAYRPWETSP